MTNSESDLSETEKAERLRAFLDGEEYHGDRDGLSIGGTHESILARQMAQVDAAFAELEAIDDVRDGVPAAAADEDDPGYERIDHAPTPTPFDKARARIVDAEILRDGAEPDSAEYHEKMAELADAKRAFKLEQDRATDDGWRKRRVTDEWRAGEGREEYNASRRKRSKANSVTPKHILDAMTPEQRARHDADKNAMRVWKSKKRKAGWTEARIDAELPGWWARRNANKSCAQSIGVA